MNFSKCLTCEEKTCMAAPVVKPLIREWERREQKEDRRSR